MRKVVHSKQWQELRKNNDWDNFYKDSAESEKFLKEQRKKYDQLIKDAGF